MSYYCEQCLKLHNDTELCQYHIEQLKKDPSIITHASTFVNVSGQYNLVTSQGLDILAEQINRISGTNISLEGSKQLARDIQVFKRLNEEAYVRLGIFNSPDLAKNYLKKSTISRLKNINKKLAGSAQEVDWLLSQKSKLNSLINKNVILNKNAVGVDGETINRFTDKVISRTTVKAAQTNGGLNTNVQGIVKAIKNGSLSPDDIVFGIEGTKKSLIDKISKEIAFAKSIGDNDAVIKLSAAQGKISIKEFSNTSDVSDSVNRLKNKISVGQAVTTVTIEQVAGQMVQGAVIGAAIGLTISSLSTYMRYKNGELPKEQAFKEIGEDTLKSTIIGAGMAGITIFLPGGVIGFAAGMAIGIYFNATLTNLLDEVFGKGAYYQILTSSGYIMGMSKNLKEVTEKVSYNSKKIKNKLSEVNETLNIVDIKINNIYKLLEE